MGVKGMSHGGVFKGMSHGGVYKACGNDRAVQPGMSLKTPNPSTRMPHVFPNLVSPKHY